jgi:hypothetical protein
MTCTDVSRRLLVASLTNNAVSLVLSCRVFFHKPTSTTQLVWIHSATIFSLLCIVLRRIYYTKERTQTEGFREQVVEEDIWAEGGGRKRRLDKIA